MLPRLLIFALGLVVGISGTLGITPDPEAATRTWKAWVEPPGVSPSPALAGLPTTEFQAPNSVLGGASQLRATLTLPQIVPAVVRVRTKSAAGSGVIIDPLGVVLTNAHLIGDSQRVHIVIEDTKQVVGKVSRIDSIRDLALVELPPGNYHWARLGQGADVVLGAPVTAIGYPLNLAGPATVTSGIVSRILHEPESLREVIQTDAAINIGSSGGPLLDAEGTVIGLVTSILGEYKSRPTSGISYAVSMKTIRDDFLGFTPNE